MRDRNFRGVAMLAGLLMTVLCFIAWLFFTAGGHADQAALGFKGFIAGLIVLLFSGVFPDRRK